jgi:hypothetical protein
MSSCSLVRVFCKQETNQKVKTLREELELKDTVIEDKDTKLKILLQDPFGVIKLLATQYFNLRRSIKESSNFRTRQLTKEQAVAATVAVAAVSEKNSSDSDRDVIEGLMEKIEKNIDSLSKAKTIADKAEEVAKKVEEVAKKAEEVAALQAAALQAAAAVEELETGELEELEAQAEAAKVAAEQAKAQVEAVALQAKAALQAAENGDLTELEAEELEAQVEAALQAAVQAANQAREQVAAAAAAATEAQKTTASAIVQAKIAADKIKELKEAAEKIEAAAKESEELAEIAEQAEAAKVAAEQAKAQVEAVALQAKASKLDEIEIFMSENYKIDIAGCYKSILDILGNLSKQNIKNKLKEFINCCYNNYVVGVDAEEDEYYTEISEDTIIFTSKYGTDTLTRKMMNPYYNAPYKKVIINGFINIGNGAFRDWYTNLEEVVIGDSVKTIGKEVFAYCEALKKLVIGESVETIGYRAFYYCTGLNETLVIPDSVISIGEVEGEEDKGEVFYRCNGLTKIVIGNKLEKIGRWTFSYCYNIYPVVISDATAKKLNSDWTSPGTAKDFRGAYDVEFIEV